MMFCRALLLFSFFLSSMSFSQQMSDKDFLKLIVDTYKEQRKENKERVRLKRARELADENICVGCLEIDNLVFHVNKALYYVAEEEERKNPKNRTIERVESLEAMYHYTMSTNKLGEQECRKSIDGFKGEYLGIFDEEESDLLFSNMVPIGALQAAHIRNGEKKIYYYRGAAPDRNVVVKVEVDGSDRAKVSYFKVVEDDDFKVALRTEEERKEMVKQAEIARIKREKEEQRWGSWIEGTTGDDKDYVTFGAGFDVEHRDYLPRKLTLLKGHSNLVITDDLNLKTKTEVSSKDIETTLSLANDKGRHYLELGFDPSGAEISVPTKFDLFETDYAIKAAFSANTDREQKLSFELLGTEDSMNKLEVKNSTRGTGFMVERIHDLDNKQTVSLKFGHDSDNGNSAFVRYVLRF
jgi:hypothetical protein